MVYINITKSKGIDNQQFQSLASKLLTTFKIKKEMYWSHIILTHLPMLMKLCSSFAQTDLKEF